MNIPFGKNPFLNLDEFNTVSSKDIQETVQLRRLVTFFFIFILTIIDKN